MDPKRPAQTHIIIKTAKLKDKGRILKTAREKQLITSMGALIRLSSDYSTETFYTTRE